MTQPGTLAILLVIAMGAWRYYSVARLGRALSESEARLSSTLEAIAEGVWDWNIVTGDVFFSSRWPKIFGYTLDEIELNVSTWEDRIHPEDKPRVMECLNEHFDGKTEMFTSEHRMKHRNGDWIWVLDRGRVIARGKNGKPLRMVGVDLDITERKRTEKALIDRTHDLGERVKELNCLYSLSNILNQTDISLEIAIKAAVEVIRPAWQYPDITCGRITVGDRRAATENFKYTAWGQASDIIVSGERVGEIEVCYLEETPEFDEGPFLNEERDLINQMAERIGEWIQRTRMEHQHRHSQRMEAVGQLTGGVAHDFNNLMAIMINNAELLKDGVGEDEEARECIEAIIAAVDRGASLTGRLLAFSRKSRLVPVENEVFELIGGLDDMLRRTLGETVELKVESVPDLWPAMFDAHQFENALINLAINARDAMPKGGKLTIEAANVTLDKTYGEQHEEMMLGDYVKVAVSDNGTGMPPEVLEKVFEPFFTTKEVGEGSGLGLSMVYGFVKQSKGHITIYSAVDHGTTVKLYMPRSTEGAAETSAKDDAVELPRGSERILVVEDDPEVRKGPLKILRDHGYEVVEAEDGEEATGHLKTGQPFDLLFTDVVLPGGMNGLEIAEEAKRLQPSIKVLYATGYAENAVVHHGNLDPGATLVNKPYRRAELLQKIRAMLNGEGG